MIGTHRSHSYFKVLTTRSTIENAQAGVKTVLNTGAGNDLVDVKAVSSHTFVNLGAGDDTINVHDDSHLLEPFQGNLSNADMAQLVATTAETKAGDLSFSTNDSDKDPFNFRIAGTVGAAAANLALGKIYVKDEGSTDYPYL